MTQKIETSKGAITVSELRERLLLQAAESDDFRTRLLNDPKAVLRDDYNLNVPEHINLFVHEDDATTAHLVLPRSKELTEAELASVAGGNLYY